MDTQTAGIVTIQRAIMLTLSTLPEIRLRTARLLFCDVLNEVDNRVDQAIGGLVDAEKLINDCGWLRVNPKR